MLAMAAGAFDNGLLITLVCAFAAYFVAARKGLHLAVPLLILMGVGIKNLWGDTAVLEKPAEYGFWAVLYLAGIEFAPSRLKRIWRVLLIGGGFQQLVTVVLILFGAMSVGLDWRSALVVGMAAAMSSTALGIGELRHIGKLNAPTGGAGTGILLSQDLTLLPIQIVMVAVAVHGSSINQLEVVDPMELAIHKALTVLGCLGLLALIARFVAKWALTRAAESTYQPYFLATLSVLLVSSAYLCYLAGLSAALGGLIAGFMVSGHDARHQAKAHVESFASFLSSFFYIWVGAQLDLQYLASWWHLVLPAAVVIILAKAMAMTAATWAIGCPARIAVPVAALLCHIGDPAFLVLGLGLKLDLITEDVFQIMSCVAVFSMLATPAMMRGAWRIAGYLSEVPRMPAWAGAWGHESNVDESQLAEHVILCGYGPVGHGLSVFMTCAGTRFVVIEMNPHLLGRVKRDKRLYVQGDFSRPEILMDAGIARARRVIITSGEDADVVRARAIIRQLRPDLSESDVLVRMRYIGNTPGASACQIVCEERLVLEDFCRRLGAEVSLL